MNDDIADILQRAGIRATSNRVIVLRTLMQSHFPLSLSEIETQLETFDKSSVSRVLNLLNDKNLVNCIEDGRGIAKYEYCRPDISQEDNLHVHFYCKNCQRVYCFEEIAIPSLRIPSGFKIEGANYMLKGLCPNCR